MQADRPATNPNDYRQVFEHRRLRSAKVTRRIELRTLCKFESGASVGHGVRTSGDRRTGTAPRLADRLDRPDPLDVERHLGSRCY
jgi:hypothetical protein